MKMNYSQVHDPVVHSGARQVFWRFEKCQKKIYKYLISILALYGWSLMASAAAGIHATGSSDGVIYFDDEGWTGNWNYVCLGSNCGSMALMVFLIRMS